jgi:hypothetical protein
MTVVSGNNYLLDGFDNDSARYSAVEATLAGEFRPALTRFGSPGALAKNGGRDWLT